MSKQSLEQLMLSDDGELINPVEVVESEPAIEDKPKEKRTRIQRYVYSGVGTGIGLGIVLLVVAGLVVGIQHAQHQFAIGEWKLPEFLLPQPTPPQASVPAPGFALDLTNPAYLLQDAVNTFISPALTIFVAIGMALFIARFVLDRTHR